MPTNWMYHLFNLMYLLQASEVASSDDFEDSQSLSDDTDIEAPSEVCMFRF